MIAPTMPLGWFHTATGRQLALSVRNVGADTTIFFIHGLGGNRNQWRLQWQHFHDQPVNMVACDARGHGNSPGSRDKQDYDSALLINDLEAVFSAFRTAHNIIVAHSFGCRLILQWLVRADHTGIDGIILLGPLSPARAMQGTLLPRWLSWLPASLQEGWRPLLARQFEQLAWHPSANPEIICHERQQARHNTLFLIQSVRQGMRLTNLDALKTIRLPLRILAGDHDGLVSIHEVKTLHASLSAAQLSVLAQCGHQIMLEKPTATNTAIEELLAVHDGKEPADDP